MYAYFVNFYDKKVVVDSLHSFGNYIGFWNSIMLKRFLDLDLGIKPAFGVYHLVNEGYCNWYDFTREIFNVLGWDAQIQITPIKSSELKKLARRPVFSALKNKKLEDIGLRMRNWKEALREYLIEKGGIGIK